MLLLMAYIVDDIDEIAHISGAERNERKVCGNSIEGGGVFVFVWHVADMLFP